MKAARSLSRSEASRAMTRLALSESLENLCVRYAYSAALQLTATNEALKAFIAELVRATQNEGVTHHPVLDLLRETAATLRELECELALAYGLRSGHTYMDPFREPFPEN